MEQTFELFKKHGVLGCVVIAVLWQNNRINFVEKMLFDCYNERIETFSKQNTSKKILHLQTFAVLKKEEDEDNRKNKG